ncbi:N-acetylmuramoyl-L-alanine amidase [Roseovarius sp. MMSF_3281]|uniref:N-acetylmuramoyl-L-alanine amidase n=1 Tax=Roseovarius sp. MMSF_3281 TaxID=3046694 RepID=UPI00273ED31F|nr:N-acetylmuramoyl-L-alanine amidase [Roseovarius sp. MMSF_3281]
MNTRDIQARLAAYRIDPGPIDGLMGRKTRRAMAAFRWKQGRSIRADFHESGLHRVIIHWPVSGEGASESDLQHYHATVTHDLRVMLGYLKPEANADCTDGRYVAHTRGLNTGSIGVAIDGMIGAQEHPFDPGPAPFNRQMVNVLAVTVADFCLTYDIPLSRYTVLTHAEVEPTLGVWQRGKWDVRWLPGMDKPGGAIKVGDVLRAKIAKAMPREMAA